MMLRELINVMNDGETLEVDTGGIVVTGTKKQLLTNPFTIGHLNRDIKISMGSSAVKLY